MDFCVSKSQQANFQRGNWLAGIRNMIYAFAWFISSYGAIAPKMRHKAQEARGSAHGTIQRMVYKCALAKQEKGLRP